MTAGEGHVERAAIPGGYVVGAIKVGLLSTVFAPDESLGHLFLGRDGQEIGTLPIRHDAQFVQARRSGKAIGSGSSPGAVVVAADAPVDPPTTQEKGEAAPWIGRLALDDLDVAGVKFPRKGKPIKLRFAWDSGEANEDSVLGHETGQVVAYGYIDAEITPTTPPPKPVYIIGGRDGKDGQDGKDGKDGKPGAPGAPGGGGPGGGGPGGGPDGGGGQGRAYDPDTGDPGLYDPLSIPEVAYSTGPIDEQEFPNGVPCPNETWDPTTPGQPVGGWVPVTSTDEALIVGGLIVPTNGAPTAEPGANIVNYRLPMWGQPGGARYLEDQVHLLTSFLNADRRVIHAAFGGPEYLASNIGLVHVNSETNPPAASRIGAHWTAPEEGLELALPVFEVTQYLVGRDGAITTRPSGGEDDPVRGILNVERAFVGHVEDERALIYLDPDKLRQGGSHSDYIRTRDKSFVIDSDGATTTSALDCEGTCAADFVAAVQGLIPSMPSEEAPAAVVQAGMGLWLRDDGALMLHWDGTDTALTGGGGGSSSSSLAHGDGRDGDVTLDGATDYPDFATRSGSLYTLTRHVFADELVIDASVALDCNGFGVFGKTSIVNNGTIRDNGSMGSAVGPGGAGAPDGEFLGGADGGDGAIGAAALDGDDVTNGLGGAGGAGGAGTTHAAGAGGTVSAPSSSDAIAILTNALIGAIFSGGAWTRVRGGGGGGGGGSTNSSEGGGGGGGGGYLLLSTASLTNNGSIQANGGAGGDGAPTGGSGGGGGGGGVVALIVGAESGSGTVTVAGGAGGNGFGTRPDGAAGSAGRVMRL